MIVIASANLSKRIKFQDCIHCFIDLFFYEMNKNLTSFSRFDAIVTFFHRFDFKMIFENRTVFTRTSTKRRKWIVKLRSEEHTSELQSRENLVCRLLLETQNEAFVFHSVY